ncbi:MAG TPA: amidase [Stellaceae bacterium]|nr:amidase [Stellaceae bacterium]
MTRRVKMATDFCAAITPEARMALAERQLAALATREATVRAFARYDTAAARRQLALGATGPLSGALIGVKDIITTADFPTLYGSSDPANAGPLVDAWCVHEAKRLGATLLGKTHCTEFAYPHPGPTTNPHDPLRSPGGSSSGSAAAVAAGFVSFALGTQTAGSTIRPASYCGITGMKPSYGLLHLEGIEAISTTCDHVGVFALSPRDAWYLVSAMTMRRAEVIAARRPHRLLFIRLPVEIPQGDHYPERLAALAASLAADGIDTETIDLPFPLADFRELQKELCYWEAARLLLMPKRKRLVPELEALLGPYIERDLSGYAEARRRREAFQAQFAAIVTKMDAVLLPAATGVAPPRANTGDAVMSRFWTALHVPALSVPFWRGDDGLPLGLQLLGALGSDRALAAVGQWFLEQA